MRSAYDLYKNAKYGVKYPLKLLDHSGVMDVGETILNYYENSTRVYKTGNVKRRP